MKKLLGAVVFLCVFSVLYQQLDSVLHIKTDDGIGTMHSYYDLPKDTVDVLMVGSSHIGMNISPKELWLEEGIAGYNLWSGMQPIWNSYYFVKEGLKTQKPKLVVVETFLCGVTVDYSDTTVALKSVQAVKPSMDQVKASGVSFQTWQQSAEALWGMPTYHNRYAELTENDFTFYQGEPDTGIQDIAYASSNVYPVKMLDYGLITEELPLTEKSETYLYKTIDLCKSMGVPLLLMLSPYQATQEEYMRLNTVKRIAKEEGVDFLDYLTLYQAAGIDPENDFLDVGHLNNDGIPKLTAHLGRYLKEHYDLPDRRFDEAHLWYNNVKSGQQDMPSYALDRQFQGDGISRYIDTGMKLYENRYGSWTLLTRLHMKTYGDDEVYLSCFSEEEGVGNFGLLVRKENDETLSLKLGSNMDVAVAVQGDTLDLAIVKRSETYDIYADGICVVSGRELPCNAYVGNLLIGCQELSPNGEKFRLSRTHVMNLELYEDQTLSAEQIADWSPEKLPDTPLPLGLFAEKEEEVYSLQEQFMGGDGQYLQELYVDTNVKLYDEPSNCFTVFARILPQELGNDNVYFACFSEEEGRYRGLLVRQTALDRIDLLLGSNYAVQAPCVAGQPLDLVIVKDIDSYTVYADGVKIADSIEAPCASYQGTLLIGCEETAEGEKFRFSKTRVSSLQVFSGAMNEKDVQNTPIVDAKLPEMRTASSAQYQMKDPFMGDGRERFVDTGIRLYDAPNKDWTLTAELTIDSRGKTDAYFSCFSEETGRYRGLLLRSNIDDSLTLFLGNDTVTVLLAPNEEKYRFVIVKEGIGYRVFLNGEKIAEIESECFPYDGTLLLGCQETAEGEKFRFAAVKIDEFSVQDGAVSSDQAQRESLVKVRNQRF